MMTFKMTAQWDQLQVLVDGKEFGYVTRTDGFFTSAATVKDFLRISSDDLRKIADKLDELKQHPGYS